MTARDTIGGSLYGNVRPGWEFDVADLVIRAVRGMPHDELAELRPDIATEFYILKEQAAQRGHYLLTTLRAHQTAQHQGDQ